MSEIDQATDLAAMIEAYYDAGWTDGLPAVPPSDATIATMLSGAKLRGDEIVGEIHGRNAVVTAESLAINAVMAGCRPEYAPVIVAAVKSLCHPDFAYHGPASSTGGSAMVLIVSGPIAAELGVNSGHNAFGQGHRANATIGRAVRLIMMNALNTKPGFFDRATFGNPGKYSFCFAERDDTPWEPFHVSRGFGAGESTLTLYASNSLQQVYNQLAATPEAILRCYADALYNLGSPNVYGFNQSLVVMGFEHADVLRANRWSRRDAQTFLVEHCRRRVADLKRAARLPGDLTPGDETTWRYAFESPEDVLLVCAGGAGSWSAVLPGWGKKWTRAITTRIE
jgi:hypothetical protein